MDFNSRTNHSSFCRLFILGTKYYRVSQKGSRRCNAKVLSSSTECLKREANGVMQILGDSISDFEGFADLFRRLHFPSIIFPRVFSVHTSHILHHSTTTPPKRWRGGCV